MNVQNFWHIRLTNSLENDWHEILKKKISWKQRFLYE